MSFDVLTEITNILEDVVLKALHFSLTLLVVQYSLPEGSLLVRSPCFRVQKYDFTDSLCPEMS